jgi:hypothetical protein
MSTPYFQNGETLTADNLNPVVPAVDGLITSFLNSGTITPTPVTFGANITLSSGVLGLTGVDLLPTGITGQFAGSLTAAGTNQGTALAITAAQNIVTTTGSGTGVVLISGISGHIGATQKVINRGANILLVYPAGTDVIEGNGAGIAVSLPVGGSATFSLNSAGQWYAS